jgi:hypothetical protein
MFLKARSDRCVPTTNSSTSTPSAAKVSMIVRSEISPSPEGPNTAPAMM